VLSLITKMSEARIFLELYLKSPEFVQLINYYACENARPLTS